jgi:hypothetical protein
VSFVLSEGRIQVNEVRLVGNRICIVFSAGGESFQAELPRHLIDPMIITAATAVVTSKIEKLKSALPGVSSPQRRVKKSAPDAHELVKVDLGDDGEWIPVPEGDDED